nr:cholesterol transporter ABCA5 [Mirounga angustirostris]
MYSVQTDPENMATAIREVGVWRQTRTLLLKNYLIKCRTKKSSVQEILFPLFFLFWLILISMMHPNKRYEEVPDIELNPMDKSMLSNLILGYTPVTNITRNIMQKVSTDHLPEVIITEEYVNEKELLVSSLSKPNNFVGVVFKDFMSYELRFFPDIIPVSSIYMDSRAGCSTSCEAAQYWTSGFTVLQASIDAAIIQLKTNVSFWKELESTKAVIMGETAVVEIDTFPRGVILIYLVIAFSPFGYFLAIHIVAEKEKKLKEFLKIMGLHDTAFWLSWVLLYTSLIFLMSLLMAVIATASSLFPQSSCVVIFLLFLLYGLSSIFFALMLTPLFKKSKHVGIVEFLVTVAFGFVGLLIVFMESFPKSLVWLFSPFCQCTFLIGIAQVMHLEDFNEGALFSNLTEGPYPLIITIVMLALNSIFYVLLAVYLDQVIPGMQLLLLIFFAVQIFMFLVHRSFKNAVVPVKLVPDLYLLKPGDKPHKYKTSLLLQNSTDSDISDLTSFFTNRNIMVTMFNDSDYVSAAPHSAALNVMYSEKDYVFTAVFNSTMVCSLPVLMNIISNYYLYHLNVTESIQVWNTPFFQEITDIVFKIELYFQAALLGIIVTAMPPYFAMENAENHKIKAYTQLKLSGLLPSAYWIGQAIVDIPLFFLVLILMLGSLFAFHYGLYFYAIKFLSVVFCLIGYVPSVILFTYVTSFTFKKILNTKEFWSFIYSVTALVCIAVTEITFFMGYTVTAVLHYTFSIVIPIYPLLGCLICFIKISWKNIRKNEYTYNPWDRLLVAVISPYLQCVLWIFLLQYYEKKYGGRSIRKDPFFRTLPTKSKNRKYPEPPNNEDEDEDVKAERLKVKELMSCQCCEEKPAIMVSNLHKEYDDKKDFLLTRKVKKVATKYVSFCVKKGEILGLLGPNGAGKSTIINILVGDIEPTSGQVFLGDYSPEPTEDDDSIKYMGYCPQINPLWPDITLREHFEIYGAVKGMSSSDMKEVINRITNALDLKEHLQKTIKKLPVGIKRKLCFALSMLGNPHITLLDEPSTGMDPKAKQHMWRAIRTAFKNKKRAAILTTHYMEEAEAVCDRVAVMVSGQLRCIGTVQHLKSKFGKGYFLEIKLKEWIENLEVDRLQREIQYIFPNASRQESFSSILAYKIPKEDVPSLSQSFSKLEEAKHTFAIEEYSFSQATLEQVFVELTKEQEEEDSSCGALNSTLWWERTQEDRVVF